MSTNLRSLFWWLGAGRRERRRAAPTPTRQRSLSLVELPAPEQTLALIKRQEALCARGWPPFSVVVVDVGLSNGARDRAQRLLEVFRQRARSSDEAGWLESGQIALILPLTDRDGAHCFAEAVCRGLDTGHGPPDFLVYSA